MRVEGNITGVGTEVSPSRGSTGVDLVGDVADGNLATDILFLETSQQTNINDTKTQYIKLQLNLKVPSCPQAIFINKLEVILRLTPPKG